MRRLDVILILSLIDYDFTETNKELIEKKKEVFVLFCFVDFVEYDFAWFSDPDYSKNQRRKRFKVLRLD